MLAFLLQCFKVGLLELMHSMALTHIRTEIIEETCLIVTTVINARRCFQWCNKKFFISCREEMKAKEALLKNFFQNVSVAVRGVNISSQPMRWQVCSLVRVHSQTGLGETERFN